METRTTGPDGTVDLVLLSLLLMDAEDEDEETACDDVRAGKEERV